MLQVPGPSKYAKQVPFEQIRQVLDHHLHTFAAQVEALLIWFLPIARSSSCQASQSWSPEVIDIYLILVITIADMSAGLISNAQR